MMVRYAGPKVFVALQETEGIHDEGGTRELPVKQPVFLEFFLLWFFWQKKTQIKWKGKWFGNKEVEWNWDRCVWA